MYEHKTDKLAPLPVFYRRFLKHGFLGILLIAVCLYIGVAGYHYIDGIPWIDALHNASMILSGMGPVAEIRSDAGKIFSSCYALFSGIMFITTVGIILAPVVHRFSHKMHLDDSKR